MNVRYDDGGSRRIAVMLAGLKPTASDWTALGTALQKVVVEDNRAGVLAGLDRNGAPLAAVTYRTGGGVRARFRSVKSADFGTTTRRFKGFTRYSRPQSGILPNNNLTTSLYKRLTGPPLAPRREASRVITNLVTRFNVDGSTLHVEGAWADVVDRKGRPFLRYHFDGIGQKKRDLRGVRPAGMRLAREIVKEWYRRIRRRAGGGA